MATENPEESFTFVDKRRVVSEPAGAATLPPAAAPLPATAPATVSIADPADADAADVIDVDDLDAMIGMDESGTEADALGSYGLAAYVAGLLASEAWQRMGLIADPSTGTVQKDLPQARFSIDCVAALVGVIDQNPAAVPADLRRDLQRVLADLRLNFVEQSRR